MSPLGTLLAGVGGLFVGVAAIVSLVNSVRARREAKEAKASSPAAVYEGLRNQVQSVVEIHQETIRRHHDERDGMEKALSRERARADGAELVGLQLQAQLATFRIDMAAARSEVAELRGRVDLLVNRSKETL